ncbi:MAG TPA: DUF4352 domain-containing protein [Thermomicrobiales bacterium]|jgi:hypothetical protein
MQRKIMVLMLGGILFLLPACGGGTPTPPLDAPPSPAAPPQPTAPLKTYGLNVLVNLQGWDIAIQKVERIGNRLAWSQFSNTVPSTGTWVVIVVDVKNSGTQPQTINADDFSLRSGAITYPMADAAQVAGYGDARRGQRFGAPIAPGTSVSFYTIYDLPPDATNLLLTFKRDSQPVFAVGNATR